MWLVDAAAASYDTAADTPIVRAPLADELEVRGALDVADDETRISYLQYVFVLRVGQHMLPDRAPVRDSRDYAACQLDHAVLRTEYEQAIAAFKATMTDIVVERTDYGTSQSSIHEGTYFMPNGTAVPVSHGVRVQMTRNGRLFDQHGLPAISVNTETRYGSAKVLTNMISCETDEYPRYGEIWARDINPGALAAALDDAANTVRHDARTKGVEPWIDEYMALPQAVVPPDMEEQYGAWFMSTNVRKLLADKPQDREQAVAMLSKVFGPEAEYELASAADMLPSDIVDTLRAYGVTDRYTWLLRNTHDIQASIAEAERGALEIGLHEAYSTWRARKEAAIGRLASLAKDLGKMSTVHTTLRSDDTMFHVTRPDSIIASPVSRIVGGIQWQMGRLHG
jgi:hypothetical protein